jgi:glycosyltransferase involved in cell wall biosynthesis
MIVKDEAHVIVRCLDSVQPCIAHWTIVDTGSSDGTQDIIRARLRGIPGELHERPWRDFGTNRSEAVSLARGNADYILVMDADHVLHVPTDYAFPALGADAYYVTHRYSGVDYGLPILLADRIAWRYTGVLHEYVTADTPHRIAHLPGPWVEVFHEGARSRDPDTYRKDAAILETALANDPGNTRYAFYFAQSLKDGGQLARALDAYRKRATMGGWEEEAWQAKYQAAILSERIGLAPAEVERSYLEAWNARPSRAEPLVRLARWHRSRSEWPLALLYARTAAALPRPSDQLFVEDAVYAWSALDEVMTAAWYAGARDEGRRAAERLLAENRFPASERARIEGNAAFYR